MIAKIKTGKFIKGAFQYNLDKVKEGKAAFFYSSMFNQEEPSFNGMREEFTKMMRMCPNVSNPVFHTSLNFSPEEFLEDETLQVVCDEYMQKLGYSKTPYVVFKHQDTNHQHVHIISINIENKNGKYKKIDDSFMHYKSEAISRKIEKEFGLVIATDVNKKRKELNKLIPELKEYGEVETYTHLRQVTDHIISSYHFTDLWQLNTLLNRYNITCFKNQSTKGEDYYKFTFHNPATRKNVGVGGTPSQLGLNIDIAKILEENKNEQEEVRYSSLKDYKQELLAKFLFITQNDLDKYLKKRDIIKIGEGAYLNQKDKAIFSIKKLRLPSTFINQATLKKEYFQNIVKSATEYRRLLNIFHESTMLTHPEYISGFKKYFFKQESHLTQQQKDLLIDSFLHYQQNNIDKIQQSEHEKDIKLANKMLAYVSKLDISDNTTKLLLEKFNIWLNEDKILIGNTIDKITHEVSYLELPYYHFGQDDRARELQGLNEREMELIRCAINEKPPVLSEDIVWKNVSPFIPEDYAHQYNLSERLEEHTMIESPLSSITPTYSYGTLNSVNEYSYPTKKKKKEDDDDDEKPRKTRRKKI